MPVKYLDATGNQLIENRLRVNYLFNIVSNEKKRKKSWGRESSSQTPECHHESLLCSPKEEVTMRRCCHYHYSILPM